MYWFSSRFEFFIAFTHFYLRQVWRRKLSVKVWFAKAIRRGRVLIAATALLFAIVVGSKKPSPSHAVSTVPYKNTASAPHRMDKIKGQHRISVEVVLDSNKNNHNTPIRPMAHAPVQSTTIEKSTSGPSESEGVDNAVEEVQRSWKGLLDSLQGPKLDTLILLVITSTVIPVFKRLNASPIIGFLLAGTLIGPTGLQLHLVIIF